MTRQRRLCAAILLVVALVAAAAYASNRKTALDIEPVIASSGVSRGGETLLLARLVHGEANAEPYAGQVAVASVILNRVQAPGFPKSIPDVVYEPGAFESVSNGLIWSDYPSEENIAAATAALNGWDPTYGALFFWNPYKPVNPWVWTRQIVTQIGRHVFAL
ncbi:MAG: spore cortex-lytic protein [Firmicutes bacterium]|nr:spore cortex-lytic protein [Bacillota bacterium]